MKTTLSLALSAVALVFSISVRAQKIVDPSASVLDVQARRSFLKSTSDRHIQEAVSRLGSCVASTMVPAPTGEMQIPHHYMHGSNGPINPAEGEATRTYGAFEKRITEGMNQWVATGNETEARCALNQLDAWAKADALTNYDPKAYSQSWFQAEWTLSSAGVTDSVLKQDDALDAAQQAQVAEWLRKAAHQLIRYEKPGSGNNHHYWRALAATSIGVLSNDDELFRHGVEVFKEAVGQEDESGAFPLEMARHENAIHYQAFALQPLIMIAEFGERQHVDLYGVIEHGRTIRDAVVFLGNAMADPEVVKKYTDDVQKTNFSADGIAELEFYLARFGSEGIPSSISTLLERPAVATRIGGNTTVLAGKKANYGAAEENASFSSAAFLACVAGGAGQPIRQHFIFVVQLVPDALHFLSGLPELLELPELPLCELWDPLDFLVCSFDRCEEELPIPEDCVRFGS